MTDIEKALQIATEAHRGQTDKTGRPYIGHPLRVMAMGRTAEEKIVGTLHDVVEDTSITLEELAKEGFGTNIIDALKCVTKTSEEEDYDSFIERCASNPLAAAVKIHDLKDNMDVCRLPLVTEQAAQRLNRYLRAYRRLLPLYEQVPRKKILYVDMDGVLVDFESAVQGIDGATRTQYGWHIDDVPGLFRKMKPLPHAIESYLILAQLFDTYILSTAPWNNPTALDDKKAWVKEYLGDVAQKRLILTHQKNLNKGDFLIDDRTLKGAAEFEGELILFGSPSFPNWESVVAYLKTKS